ncbi:C1QT1 protein, partial [Galbula dea]|nr:C1QT1 protein [Galbula dea]
LLTYLLLPSPLRSQTSSSPSQRLQTDPEEAPAPSQHHAARATWEQKAGSAQELPPRPRCVRCCEPPDQRFSYPQYQPVPQINMTILKGEKGDRGE